MRRYVISSLLLPLSVVFISPAFAAGVMKAGLWELRTESGAAKSLPKMSPEQTAQMRKLGVDLSKLQSGVIVNKTCITKEMAAHDELPQMDQGKSGCTMQNQQHSGATYTMDMVCDGPQMKGKGVLKTVFSGDESFHSSMDFKGALGGASINNHSDTSGKWLGADCGSVKPLGQAKK